MEKSYYNVIETLLLILSADEGKLKIYLEKKKNEPYKGYWIIPGSTLDNETTLEQNAENIYKKATGLDKGTIFQTRTFSNLNRLKNERVIASSFIAITYKNLTYIKQNTSYNAWFQID